MNEPVDARVLAYRIGKLRKAPREWIICVAVFTAMNGLLLALNQIVSIPAGLVSAYAFPGSPAHWVAALSFAALGYFAKFHRSLLVAAGGIYLLDTVFAVYLQSWVAVLMHAAVFVLVAINLNGLRLLKRQLARGDGSVSDV